MVRLDERARELWQVNRNVWLCLLFLGVLVPWAGALGWMRGPAWGPWLLYGAAVGNAALRTYTGWRRRGQPDRLAWAFTLVDAALISAGVWLTGGLRSELWLLFVVLVVAETLVCPRAEALALGAVAVVGYAAATWGDRSEPGYGLTMLTRLFFAGVAAAFARRIGAVHLNRAAELAALREEAAASHERARIAREVHDSLGHAMVASILRIDLCARLVRSEPDEVERILKEEAGALRSAWDEGRDLAFSTHRWDAGPGGIGAALRRHVEQFARRSRLDITVECPDGLALPGPVEMAALRIVQEALTNVARYAHARTARVAVRCTEDAVELSVEDDGVGVSPDAPTGSRGIQGMRGRAEELGGALTLAPRTGGGTVVAARIPCGKDRL